MHISAWEDIVRSANEHNDPGNFTAFIGYEFTTSTDTEGGNLHRNVLFNSSKAPIRPWTRIDSINPEDLWTWQDGLREKGVDTISMPHNSNGSNGQMFEMETFKGGAHNSCNRSRSLHPLLKVVIIDQPQYRIVEHLAYQSNKWFCFLAIQPLLML